MKKIEYSVLQYSPSFITGECINLGILVYCAEDKKIKFEHITERSHYNRLHTFDDELDLEVVKNVLSMISEDIDDIEYSNSLALINEYRDFDISEYIKYFQNEFNFTKTTFINYDSFEDAINELKNIYLRLYIPKKSRPSKRSEQKFIERVMDTNNYKYSKNKKIHDEFGINVTYDYVLNENTGIKFFNAESNNISRIINDIKAWAWNCEHGTLEKLIIIYNFTNISHQKDVKVESVLKLLRSQNDYVTDLDNFAILLKDFKINKY